MWFRGWDAIRAILITHSKRKQCVTIILLLKLAGISFDFMTPR